MLNVAFSLKCPEDRLLRIESDDPTAHRVNGTPESLDIEDGGHKPSKHPFKIRRSSWAYPFLEAEITKASNIDKMGCIHQGSKPSDNNNANLSSVQCRERGAWNWRRRRWVVATYLPEKDLNRKMERQASVDDLVERGL